MKNGRVAPQGKRDQPFLSPLLALQEARHLPGHRAVVHLHGRGRAAAPGRSRRSRSVTWIPHWGEERIAGMVAGRPDWCISRQRSWGVPIPAFTCKACGAVVADAAIARHVAGYLRPRGLERLVPEGGRRRFCPPARRARPAAAADFDKENNILDVWFESGASHSILGKRPDLPWPADVYIEGHDQHRGWFNSSLLVGVGRQGRHSPYRTCITHGFVLDEQGRAMSKSLGNVIEPDEIISKNGAEILRLWVAMLNLQGGRPLRRRRSSSGSSRPTARSGTPGASSWATSTTSRPDADSVARGRDRLVLDRWILQNGRPRSGRRVAQGLRRTTSSTSSSTRSTIFFTVDLSAFYLDVIKDRALLFGEELAPAGGRPRRPCSASSRTPWPSWPPSCRSRPTKPGKPCPPSPAKRSRSTSELFPVPRARPGSSRRLVEDMDGLLGVREKVLKELEKAREDKLIGNSLEAGSSSRFPPADATLLEKYRDDLGRAVHRLRGRGRSRERRRTSASGSSKAAGAKCERCWN